MIMLIWFRKYSFLKMPLLFLKLYSPYTENPQEKLLLNLDIFPSTFYFVSTFFLKKP